MFTRRQFLAGCAALAVLPAAFDVSAGEACHRIRGLVILVRFPGMLPAVSKRFVGGLFGRLGDYVGEMSYGGVCTEFDISDWLEMPEPVDAYSISPVNLQVDKSRVTKLIQHAIDAADGTYDFSRYDYIVVYMGARFQDYGMVGLCGYPGMLGWSNDIAFRTTQRGQVVPNGVAIFTSSAHLGTLFHDSAHVWGGVVDGKRRVPCLYDHDLQIQYPTIERGWANALINMGYWDPMSCHSYKRTLPPPGISSWTKLRLGWLPPEKVAQLNPDVSAEVVLGPLERGTSEVLAIRIPLSSTRYILIENRQPIGGYDSVLPGHGVLIMKADDTVAECRHGRAPVRLVDADPSQPYLLGAAFDLPDRGLYRDTEDGIEIRLLEKIGDAYRIAVSRIDRH